MDILIFKIKIEEASPFHISYAPGHRVINHHGYSQGKSTLKKINMDIWVAGISNQVFIKDSYAELKTKLVTGSFAWKCRNFNLNIFN